METRHSNSLLRKRLAKAPMLGAIVIVVAFDVFLLVVPALNRNKFVGIVIEIPWFLPAHDCFMVLVGASIAFLSFGRFRALNDPFSFWAAIGFASFAVGVLFNLLTFPDLLPPGLPIISQATSSSPLRSMMAASMTLSIALLVSAVAARPSEESMRGFRGILIFGLWITSFVLLHVMLVVFGPYLPNMFGPEGSPSHLANILRMGTFLVSSMGAVLAIRRYILMGDVFSRYVGLGQILNIPLNAIFPQYHVRFGVWWYLQFLSWFIGFSVVFFGLLSEYVQLFRREQGITRRLWEALGIRDQFISIASHELRTPLAALTLQLQLARRSILRQGVNAMSKDQLQKVIDGTERQVKRLTHLVEDMLDLSRISAGKLSMNFEFFSLSDLVNQVVEDMSEQFMEAECPVQLHLEKNILGEWDRFRIEQVILNLLTNALKYASGKPVEIFTMRKGADAVLIVRDQGRGIAIEDQGRIFRKFERLVSQTEVSGMGVGLFICREVLLMHGGAINVKSELGKGSSFIVTLPMKRKVEKKSTA